MFAAGTNSIPGYEEVRTDSAYRSKRPAPPTSDRLISSRCVLFSRRLGHRLQRPDHGPDRRGQPVMRTSSAGDLRRLVAALTIGTVVLGSCSTVETDSSSASAPQTSVDQQIDWSGRRESNPRHQLGSWSELILRTAP